MKQEYLNDVPVLIIFFCRDSQLEKVFEQVKKARPSKLYLYQDGARPGREDDVIGIEKCRKIVADENIDWNCEIHRKYQNNNFGCDPSEFIAQKWMFETEEMGIILEDDDIPSVSFFPFCKELLQKYKDDTRINMICGMNNIGVSDDIKESYFFTQKGSIWGWASWRRVLDTWDGSYSWLDDPEKLGIIRSQMSRREYDVFIKTAKEHRKTGREHYESINAAANRLGRRLNIVPKYNMITNIGIAEESTHSVNDIRLLPKKSRRLIYMERFEIEFPLIHPDKVVRNVDFEKKMTFTKMDNIFMKVESLFLLLKYKGVQASVKKILQKIRG